MNQPGTSSGSIAVTAGAAVTGAQGPGVLLFAQLIGGTTANAFTIYDGVDTSGLMLVNLKNVTAGVSANADVAQGIAFNTGLFVVVSGTGSTGLVIYRKN